jgi:hypothetical protein
MKATIIGTVTSVTQPIQTPKGYWKQDFVLKEEGSITNHFIIQVHASTKDQLDDMHIKGRVGAEVTCYCYLNGYRYHHKIHGDSYGLRLVLNKIEP